MIAPILLTAILGGNPSVLTTGYACDDHATRGEEDVAVRAVGTTGVVAHYGVQYNCGLALGVDVEAGGGELWLRERQLGEDLRCTCFFPELRYELHDLSPGTYVAHVVKIGEEKPFWSGVLEVLGGLQASIGHGPDKGWDPEASERVTIVPVGRAIRVEHRDAPSQCCLELAVDWILQGDRLSLLAVDHGPPCDCIGRFDLWILVGDLPPGRYRVGYTDLRGRTTTAEVELTGPPPGAFLRGEVNGDGRVDLADPVFILAYAFVSGPVPPCLDAADANDDGAIDLADPIWLLAYLFASGPAPPAPFPDPGPDPTDDGLACAPPS